MEDQTLGDSGSVSACQHYIVFRPCLLTALSINPFLFVEVPNLWAWRKNAKETYARCEKLSCNSKRQAQMYPIPCANARCEAQATPNTGVEWRSNKSIARGR